MSLIRIGLHGEVPIRHSLAHRAATSSGKTDLVSTSPFVPRKIGVLIAPTMAPVDLGSPLNAAAGFVPMSSEHALAHPIIILPERQITDEELESQAAFVRLRNHLRKVDDIDNGVLNHRQTIHNAYTNVQKMKKEVAKFEAEFWGKGSRTSSSGSVFRP